jgi:uncharacterized protein YndB with AHSA1/START domain
MHPEPLVVEKILNAPVSRVWKALTDVEVMKKWYFSLSDFKAEPGFEFSFTGENNDIKFVHLCKVTEVIVERKLSYSWTYEGYPGYSEVTFELFPQGETTRLKLTHAGLETFPQDSNFARENFVGGWNYIIDTSLKNYLAS